MEREQSRWIGRRLLVMLIVVCCVWVCGCVLCVGATFSYHTGRKSTLAKAKWPTFAHSYHKISPQTQTPQILLDVQTCHHSEILHTFWLFGCKNVRVVLLSLSWRCMNSRPTFFFVPPLFRGYLEEGILYHIVQKGVCRGAALPYDTLFLGGEKSGMKSDPLV